MAEKKTMMPQSTAGLVRYFEDTQSAIKLKPEHVVAISIVIMAGVLVMRFLG